MTSYIGDYLFLQSFMLSNEVMEREDVLDNRRWEEKREQKRGMMSITQNKLMYLRQVYFYFSHYRITWLNSPIWRCILVYWCEATNYLAECNDSFRIILAFFFSHNCGNKQCFLFSCYLDKMTDFLEEDSTYFPYFKCRFVKFSLNFDFFSILKINWYE